MKIFAMVGAFALAAVLSSSGGATAAEEEGIRQEAVEIESIDWFREKYPDEWEAIVLRFKQESEPKTEALPKSDEDTVRGIIDLLNRQEDRATWRYIRDQFREDVKFNWRDATEPTRVDWLIAQGPDAWKDITQRFSPDTESKSEGANTAALIANLSTEISSLEILAWLRKEKPKEFIDKLREQASEDTIAWFSESLPKAENAFQLFRFRYEEETGNPFIEPPTPAIDWLREAHPDKWLAIARQFKEEETDGIIRSLGEPQNSALLEQLRNRVANAEEDKSALSIRVIVDRLQEHHPEVWRNNIVNPYRNPPAPQPSGNAPVSGQPTESGKATRMPSKGDGQTGDGEAARIVEEEAKQRKEDDATIDAWLGKQPSTSTILRNFRARVGKRPGNHTRLSNIAWLREQDSDAWLELWKMATAQIVIDLLNKQEDRMVWQYIRVDFRQGREGKGGMGVLWNDSSAKDHNNWLIKQEPEYLRGIIQRFSPSTAPPPRGPTKSGIAKRP